MKKRSAMGELVWDHAVQDIPELGLSMERAADKGELEAIARALDLIACAPVTARYTITPNGLGRYRLKGRLYARVEQACVVTLEPVASTIEEPIDVVFWPSEALPAPTSGVVELDEEADPEPIREGRIEGGRVVFECLAASIEPFPRSPGAALERNSSSPTGEAGGEADSPFAALASLRPKG